MMARGSRDPAISVGTQVRFDSEQGPQAGVVEDIRSDISNGQRIAIVHVPGTLGGMPWRLPIDQLQHAGA